MRATQAICDWGARLCRLCLVAGTTGSALEVQGRVEDEARARRSSDFGALLRRYRLAAGLSQEALAERARMSSYGVSALERGHRRNPQRETLALLAGALALNEGQRLDFEAAAVRSRGPRRLGAGRVAADPWLTTATSNLPLALTSFVGRDSEVTEIAQLARAHRLVTLIGTGGVGKTQTALHVATTLGNADNLAFYFVGLAPVREPSLVVSAIASALGVQEASNVSLLETMLAYLKNKTLLLILDNCEHVITEAASVVGTLLVECRGIRILATSREPLRAAGEHTYRLPSLSLPASIVLFTDRARAVDHCFALDDESASTVAKICRRLDGIPLAIELAAARVNFLSVKALSERIDDRFQILTGGQRTASTRQQTMRGAIDWSYDLLSTEERRVFERLSVFSGGCTLASAAVVCLDESTAELDAFEVLSSLVDKSLVVADFESGEPRYRLLESFRHYGREKLAASGEQDIVARRHALAYLELAERLDRTYDIELEEFCRAVAQEELDNWRAAMNWALTDCHDIVLGQRLVGELNVVWRNFATLEGRRWLLAALKVVDAQTPAIVLARLAYTEATIASILLEHDLQLTSSQRAIAQFRAAGSSIGLAQAQGIAGHAHLLLGRVVEAHTMLNEALAVARKSGNHRLAAWILRCLAFAAAIGGDIVSARDFIAEALEIYEVMGAKVPAALAVFDLSEHEFRAGNVELAHRHSASALAMFRTLGDMRLVATALDSLAIYLAALERYDEAADCAQEALNVAREYRLDTLGAYALQRFGVIAARRPQILAEYKSTAYTRAARILGFVDARLAAAGSTRQYPNKREYDLVLALLRDAMGTAEVNKLMAAGATMTEAQAVAEALDQ